MEKRIAIVLEKFGTAVWKRFIQNAEFGLCPKEYNRRVHGIYVPWRYYGKADIPFGQVKISDLGAWIKRRNKTPIAIWQCLDRDREGTIGRTIDDYLKNKLNLDDHVVHLLYSADRWSSASVIQEKLSAGISLIVDRYAYSGVAYSSAKGLDFDWCKRPDVGLPKPDIVFYMDLSPALAADRKDYGEEKYEHLHFQKSVYEKFKELEDPTWKILDASKTIEEINKQIVAVSDRILEYDLTVDMPKLWTDN